MLDLACTVSDDV